MDRAYRRAPRQLCRTRGHLSVKLRLLPPQTSRTMLLNTTVRVICRIVHAAPHSPLRLKRCPRPSGLLFPAAVPRSIRGSRLEPGKPTKGCSPLDSFGCCHAVPQTVLPVPLNGPRTHTRSNRRCTVSLEEVNILWLRFKLLGPTRCVGRTQPP